MHLCISSILEIEGNTDILSYILVRITHTFPMQRFENLTFEPGLTKLRSAACQRLLFAPRSSRIRSRSRAHIAPLDVSVPRKEAASTSYSPKNPP